jgi:glutamate 5-kinase
MGKRIVVKIGSQVLCDPGGALNRDILSRLVQQLGALSTDGWQVLLVTSGAVAAGKSLADERIQGISDPVARPVAQVLTSKSDFQTRRHYLNMRGCIEALLTAGVVPIVNENDVVAVTELMFTDNDELAGLLAGMVNADLLCLLSTVPGVYDGDPDDPATQCIEYWDDRLHQIEDIVSRGTSSLGRGGMHSKLTIARKAAKLGTEVVIADGADPEIMSRILGGGAGTRFPALGEASPAKRWLASADGHATGSVTVNAGAESALTDSNRLASLLPVGIEAVDGRFSRGDVIQILNPGGRVLGCGQARYDHREAGRLMGQRGQKPLIHYDYLYLVD